ncbi:MAG: VPLPA-CTERM-specific exosortase XrtD [Geobacteraceae bacterium]|nr:VPLPA-CTERM-specific exosortase XrtD [Geobacteraceae bacterium]
MKLDLNKIANIKPVDWLRLALYSTLLFFVYHTSLVYLFRKWQDEDFTYCYIIPLIALYLIWEKKERLAAIPSQPSWKGMYLLVPGLLLFWLGELGGEFTMLFLSLWLVIVSLCWFHLGWRKLVVIAFPLVYGLASFVPPNALYLPLTFRLKLISSQIGVKLMQLYGLSAFREGNVIDLGFTQLQVVDACSGLRYVIPLFLMGVLLAYYYRASLWKKIVLVLSTLPISVITNSLRIASVGVLYQFMGAAAAEGFFHDFSGWFIFIAGLAFLLLEMWLMNKIVRESGVRSQESEKSIQESGIRSQESGESPLSAASDQQPATDSVATSNQRPATALKQSAVAIALLLVTLAASYGIDFREKTPLVKPFSSLPLQIGEWKGTQTAMEQKFLDVLKLSDYAMIDYRNPTGREINFYVAYNSSQSKGEATHSPGTCLPGSGWDFRESGAASIPESAGTTMQVSKAFMEKSGVRQLVYYWFPQRGRILTNLYQIKLYNFWDALTRQRTDGALVRIISPVYDNETPADTEARLQGFTKEIVPVLNTFLPR